MSCRMYLVVLLLCVACMGANCGGNLFLPTDDSSPPTGAQSLFDEAWTDFDQNYSYFDYKGVDWDTVRQDWRPDFAADLTGDQFADLLAQMLGELHDWHVAVKKPDGTWLPTHTGEIFQNAPDQLFDAYSSTGTYTKIGDNIIFHTLLTGNIAHIVITTLETGPFSSVSDGQIGNLFVTYQSAAGMIIDIRYNSGGNEENAKKIVSRLINARTVYGYHETRVVGDDHSAFGDLVEHAVEVSPNLHYTGPVVGLIGQRCMSSAEWFTLMLREAGATLIGDTTRGASGNPAQFDLSNQVSFMVSTWIAYDKDMVAIEDLGIAPDLTVDPENSFDTTHDYVLEEAINFLTP